MKKPIHTCQHYLLPAQKEAIIISPPGEITRVPIPKYDFELAESTLCQLLACESVKVEVMYHWPTSEHYNLVSASEAGVYESGLAPAQGIPLNSAVSALWEEAYAEYALASNKPQQAIRSVYGTILIYINKDLPF
jgi:hypothetical protein